MKDKTRGVRRARGDAITMVMMVMESDCNEGDDNKCWIALLFWHCL